MVTKEKKSKYGKIRKILIPVSYIILLSAIGIIFHRIATNNPFHERITDEDSNSADYDSLIPMGMIDHNNLKLPVSKNLMIKGLSYFTVAKNTTDENKREYYLKTIRTLSGLISKSLLDNNHKDINSLVYYHLAYSYLLFGEEYFDISLRYFIVAEKMNNTDRMLSKKTEGKKLPLLELYELTGSIYFQLGQYKNSKQYFSKAKSFNRNELMYNLVIAHSSYEIGEYKDAYNHYKIVSVNFDSSNNPIFTDQLKRELYLILAKLNYIMENYLLSINCYEDYIKDYGDSAEIRYVIGKIYETLSFKKGKSKEDFKEKAIKQWKKSLEIKPTYGKSMLKLWRYNVDL